MIELTAPAARSGLFTTQAAAVPLAGVAIDAEISSFCARVSVAQRYVNLEANPIEAVYVFPLDEGAAVCGFEAIIDGTHVVGEVKERDEAFKMYDEAMERGDGGFLLDEERPDVFQASVGNLPPGKEVLLKLTYVTELTVEGGGLRFAIPTTVSPRYAPSQDRVGVGRPDSEALNPPVAWRVPYGLDLSVRLAMPGAITRVASPSHPVSVTMNGSEATVALSQRDAALDRDFVLSVETAGLDTPQAWVERDEDGSQAIAVAFAPKLPQASRPAEVVFLVDRSGSMGGTSIEEARNALQLCLRSMIAGCRFNIIGFGSSHRALFRRSRPYDDSSLSEASAHVAAMAADLGGTELLPALELALKPAGKDGLARQVVILTDGQVTNTDACIALAKEHAAEARIFTFGIGAGASHHLVKGLARAGGGTAEFIYPGERIEPKVVRQFGRLLSPSLTDARMDWGGLAVTQAPSAVPQVFAGGRLLVYGFITAGAAATARLTAESPSGPISFEVPLDPANVRPGRTVATLGARARIRELEESSEWISARGSRQAHRRANAAAQEVIALGLRYGLVSRETSYVAIERRETPVIGDVKLRQIPVALTTGWGGLLPEVAAMRNMPGWWGQVGAAVCEEPSFDYRLSGGMPMPRAASPSARQPKGMVAQEPAEEPTRSETRSLFHAARRSRSAEAAPPPAMHTLVALQRADGSWELTRELADVVGRSLQELESAIAGATGDAGDVRKAWATALALAWLRTHARPVEQEWALLAAKAQAWVDRAGAAPARGGAWIDAAADFLRG
ncbi:MAG: VIT domain-containing protein [Acidobacteriota bacterium]